MPFYPRHGRHCSKGGREVTMGSDISNSILQYLYYGFWIVLWLIICHFDSIMDSELILMYNKFIMKLL